MSPRRVYAWLALVGLALLLALGSWRCGRHAGATGATGRLVLRNLAPSSWRITLAEVGGAAPRIVKVPARSEQSLDLPAGTYVVSQTLLDIHGQTLDHRTLRFVVERGATYTWPLASLQTTDWEEAR